MFRVRQPLVAISGKEVALCITKINDLHFTNFFFQRTLKTAQVDEESKRHGGELVAEVLQSHGVKNIFTLCGGHISPILVSCLSKGIKVVDTRHEVMFSQFQLYSGQL